MAIPLRKLGSKWTVDTIQAEGQTLSLRYGLFQPNGHEIETCVVYLNGRTEWIEKNMDLPELLGLPATCGFLTWDHRGQGASGGERSWIDSYESYVSDARKIISHAIGRTPYVILAHSMGGLIAAYGTVSHVLSPRAMALASPLLDLPNKTLAKPLAKLIAKTGLSKTSTGGGSYHRHTFRGNRLTHSREMFDVVRNTPYYVPSASFGWVDATFDASKYIFDPEKLRNFKTPTMVLSAEQETIVDPTAHKTWIDLIRRTCPDSKAELANIAGARHEIFSEVPEVRDRGIEVVRDWLLPYLD